jgi:hypothetical protein
MGNQSGQSYGLTVLSPIINSGSRAAAQDLALRHHLSKLANDEHSPFAKVPGTHFVRLVVMDDVVFVGYPARDEHLKSQYLICTADFDGPLDPYLQTLARTIPTELDAIWNHCVGYPGATDPAKFAEYMKKCQIETALYFSDVNDRTLEQTLKALRVKTAVSVFIERYQGHPASAVQPAFKRFLAELNQTPAPRPGVKGI